jgi:hypothetical protein
MGRALRRSFLRWVDTKRKKGFDIRRAAEAVTASNIIFAGLLWATFLAGFVSSTDEYLREVFGFLVVVSSFLFFGATWLQVRQAMAHRHIVASAGALVGSVWISLIGLVLLMFVAGMISGGWFGTGEVKRATETLECAKEKLEEIYRERLRLDAARGEDRRCWLSVQSDVAELNLAATEKRITEEQRSMLLDRFSERCAQFEVLVKEQEAVVTGIAEKKCEEESKKND